MPATDGEGKEVLAMRKFIHKIMCLIGFHNWEGKAANFTEQEERTITIVWWECDRCGGSKLKCIFGNWKRTP